jgi:hypothetical protein
VSGSLIAVGAPGYDDPQAGDNTGAVYLYEYDGSAWVETGKVSASQPVSGARLGSDLALDGDRLAVSGSPQAGFVCIFERREAGWYQVAQLGLPASPDGEPLFALIDLYGNTLAASTVSQYPLDEVDEQTMIRSLKRTGLVTLYEREGEKWVQTFQTAPQEAALYRMYDGPYGISVSLGGEAGEARWLAVGQPGFPGSGRESGSVAIYERGKRGWQLQAELMLAAGEQVEGNLNWIFANSGAVFFGAFVEFEASRLAVVSTFANAVYIFDREGEGWVYAFRITPAPAYGDDFQRRTAAMSGARLVLGSPGELGGGNVFVFELGP